MNKLKISVLLAISVLAGVMGMAACSGRDAPRSDYEVSRGDSPSIVVHTEFPTGTITSNAVDITYTAAPSDGATISEIWYSINGDAEEYIYLSGGNGITPKGTLGVARVLLYPGENSVVFTVKDSAGKTGSFEIANMPSFDLGMIIAPEYDPQYIADSEIHPNFKYVKNRITVGTYLGVDEKKVEKAIESIDGIILGKVNIVDRYYVQVPVGTEAELQHLCDTLLKKYPDLFDMAQLDMIEPMDTVTMPNDPWWTGAGWSTPSYTTTPVGVGEWGLTAIDMPNAWNNYGASMRNIKVGIIDAGVNAYHLDLNIRKDNTVNSSGDHDHGTHVMGTIAATRGNLEGITGIVDAPSDSLYSYDYAGFGVGIINGLTWNVINGTKVVNVSLGVKNRDWGTLIVTSNLNENESYSREMQRLLDWGYDFVVVQAAGNCAVDTWHAGSFQYVRDDTTKGKLLREHIITVGATDDTGNIAYFSNYGAWVDVLAPGVDIDSTVAYQRPLNSPNSAGTSTTAPSAEVLANIYYEAYSGTSMAAPHVAGVAALMWSANPGLSGVQIKELITDTAHKYGLPVNDTRSLIPVSDHATYFQINADYAVAAAIYETPTYTTGRLVGRVIDPTIPNAALPGLEGIANAGLSLHIIRDDTVLQTAFTDSSGQFRMDDLPVGNYYLTIGADGYETERLILSIEEGISTYLNTITLIPKNSGDGTVTGNILNAYNLHKVDHVPVRLIFRRGSGFDSFINPIVADTTVFNGTYSVSLPAGAYSVTAVADGFVQELTYVHSLGGGQLSDRQTIIMSPEFATGTDSARIVLTWGTRPYDMDAHLIGPTRSGDKFHVFYFRKTHDEDIAGTQTLFASLDVDGMNSYGPETITISHLTNGTYDYYVHDYTNFVSTTSDELRYSQAVVKVYGPNNELIRAFYVPTDGGASTIWHVFSLEVKDGKYTVNPVNDMSNVPTGPGLIGYRFASPLRSDSYQTLIDAILANPDKSNPVNNPFTGYIESEDAEEEQVIDFEDTTDLGESA